MYEGKPDKGKGDMQTVAALSFVQENECLGTARSVPGMLYRPDDFPAKGKPTASSTEGEQSDLCFSSDDCYKYFSDTDPASSIQQPTFTVLVTVILQNNAICLIILGFKSFEHLNEKVADGLDDLVVVVVESHLHVQTHKLRQVTMRVGVFRSKDCKTTTQICLTEFSHFCYHNLKTFTFQKNTVKENNTQQSKL